MSNSFIKNLPWIAPAVAVLAVGSGVLDRINGSFEGTNEGVIEMSQPSDSVVIEPAVVAVQDPQPVAPAMETSSASDQLAVLLTGDATPAQDATTAPSGDIEVTRNTGFSIDTLEQARDGALSVVPSADPIIEPAAPAVVEQVAAPAPAASGTVGADFFATAQANLARDRQCIDELRVLASQARVYFPSGGLTGEQSGIDQARVLGLLAQQCPGVVIQVEGHSDPSGNPAANQRLSLERAQAVVTRVAASGVDASLFTAVGRGDTAPSLVSGPQPQTYYDRRVEFSVVEREILASFVAPSFGAAGTRFETAACVAQLEAGVLNASIEYAPRGMNVSDADMALASQLARIAANCPEARLRMVGQHSNDPRAGEDPSTGRLRVVVLMTKLVNAGFPADQLILGAPSDARPIEGLSDSRVDFDLILEDL